jgi:hypothetical protein
VVLGFIVLTHTVIQHDEHPVVFAQMGGSTPARHC